MADYSTVDENSPWNITEEEVEFFKFLSVDTIIITIIIPIILSLGVINNSVFLFIIFRVPKIRSATNICLAHLALADLLYLTVTSIVHNILRYAASPYVAYVTISKSHAACFTFELLKNTGYFASIALVTTVSYERYLAVCHPIKHLTIRGRRRTNTMLTICWVVGLIFACSTTLGTSAFNEKYDVSWPEGYQDYPTEFTQCRPLDYFTYAITVPLGLLPWFIAVIANVFMYIRIIYALNKRRSATFMKRKCHKAQQSRNKVAQVLIANGVVFFICQTPSVVVIINSFVVTITVPDRINEAVYILLRNGGWFSNLPLLINTIINPLIYGAIHAQYRSAFITAFRCNTGSSQSQLDKNIAAVSPRVMRRARNSNETETDVTIL